MMSQEEIELLPLLGLDYLDFIAIERYKDASERERRLEAFKVQARIGYKAAVKVLHPDHNGGDEQKTAQFRGVIELSKKIARLELVASSPVDPEDVYGVPLQDVEVDDDYEYVSGPIDSKDWDSEERIVIVQQLWNPITGETTLRIITIYR